MSRRLRVAVVGMGLQGQRLIKAIGASKRVELAATASERERGSFASVLKDKSVDAVVIASPNHRHRAQAIAAARAGKHVLCEKPLALSGKEGKAIRAAARKSGVHCFVNYHLRVHPEVQNAKKLIAQGKLGDISYVEMLWAIGTTGQKKLPSLPLHMRWRESVKAGGGTTATRGVHLFDLLRFTTGQEIANARGWSDATRTKVDQTATSILTLKGGAPAIVTTSKCVPDADNRIVIYGTKGKLELRNVFSADPHTMYVKVFNEFALACAGKKTFLATAEDGIAADKIAHSTLRRA